MTAINLVAISGNISSPSRTRGLVEAAVTAVSRHADVKVTFIDIGELAIDLGAATNFKSLPPKVVEALNAIQGAELLVVGSPVYKGSYTGLFKHLIDLVAPEALAGVPVLLTASGGTDRHALVIEHQLRPLFGFFTALTVPTGVFALDSDFENYQLKRPEIAARIGTAAEEAVALVHGRRQAAPAVQAA